MFCGDPGGRRAAWWSANFIGPLYWPYAYNDFLNYAYYACAYDAFWPGAYDDVYYGITELYGSRIGPAYVGQPASGEVSSSLGTGRTAGVTDWRINEIAHLVEPDEA